MKRENYDSGTPWESAAGYSRAVKVGSFIYVSGTTATNESGEVVGEGNMTAQAKQVIANIEKALAIFDASLENVVRTRMFITDMSRSEEVIQVHGSYFSKIRPAATLVEVTRLIDEHMLIEIEADAILYQEQE